MTLDESKSMLRSICKQQGIVLHKNVYAVVDDKIKMWRFLVAISERNFPLGFDMFDGVCSGNARLRIENDFVGLIASDCGSSEFLFMPKSIIVIIPDEDITPSFVFESNECASESEQFNNNVRESFDSYNYRYVEAVKLTDGYNDCLIFDKEEVDGIVNDWNSGREDASPYSSRKYYLTRKIFAFVDIQLKSEGSKSARIPLFLRCSFLINSQNKTIQEIDKELRKMLRI